MKKDKQLLQNTLIKYFFNAFERGQLDNIHVLLVNIVQNYFNIFF